KHKASGGARREAKRHDPSPSSRRMRGNSARIAPRDQLMTHSCLNFLKLGTPSGARDIAVRVDRGDGPGLFWLGGFKSDMKGTKAEALSQWAQQNGRACVRFDYSGHGESGGEFRDGTIGRWLEESLAVFAAHCAGPQILIGSSMGGWLALLLARELKRRADAGRPLPGSAAALVLIAPAVDFTQALMWEKFPAPVKRAIEEQGFWERPSAYGDGPYRITRRLI